MYTPCIRCGKERILDKSWTDKVGSSVITYTLTVCPDSQCQKIVEEQLNKKKLHLAMLQKDSQMRRENIRNTRIKKKHLDEKRKR